MTYSISYDEVQAYVNDLPEDTTPVGETCHTQKCIIAKAVWEKYPEAVWIWVEPGLLSGAEWIRIFVPNEYAGTVEQFAVETGEDDQKLRDLAGGFDRFETGWQHVHPTKAEVLERLFKNDQNTENVHDLVR